MHRETYELMYDQVRAIFRALTGSELREGTAQAAAPPANVDLHEVVTRRFSELEAWVRLVPPVADKVPPFTFSPPLDIVEWDGELLIELAVPGVSADEVHAELLGEMLVISGSRRGEKAANGRLYRHAEIARGPFRRVLFLPRELVSGPPRVDVDNGVIRIRIAKLPMSSVAKA
jgi:HSP20 family molecular chaperone IbpA